MGATSSKSYPQLLEENTALKLLLEEAHKSGDHTWACKSRMEPGKFCDCWFGKTADALVGPKVVAVVSLTQLVCKTCKHVAADHTGTIAGQKEAVCCMCGCPCMKFEPEPLRS